MAAHTNFAVTAMKGTEFVPSGWVNSGILALVRGVLVWRGFNQGRLSFHWSQYHHEDFLANEFQTVDSYLLREKAQAMYLLKYQHILEGKFSPRKPMSSMFWLNVSDELAPPKPPQDPPKKKKKK